MTITPLYTVWCDNHEAHVNGCPWWIANCRTRGEAWKEAQRDGWVRIDGRHFSPGCAATLP